MIGGGKWTLREANAVDIRGREGGGALGEGSANLTGAEGGGGGGGGGFNHGDGCCHVVLGSRSGEETFSLRARDDMQEWGGGGYDRRRYVCGPRVCEYFAGA